MDYASQNYLAALAMSLAIYLLLFKTRLPLLLKLLLPFGYFFLYEYGLFARSYSLVVLCMAIVISLYPMRLRYPGWYALAIVLLFNTHVLVFSFALSFTVLFLFDIIQSAKRNTRLWLSFVMMLVGGLYLLPYLYLSKMSTVFGSDEADHIALMMNAIGEGLMLSQENNMVALVLLLLSCALLFARPGVLLPLLGGLAGTLYILGYKYGGVLRHEGVVYLILLAAIAIHAYYEEDGQDLKNKRLNRYTKYSYLPLVLVTLVQIKPAVDKYTADISNPYSDAANAADYINQNGLDKKTIIAHQAWAGGAVAPYLPPGFRFYYAECDAYGTYYDYKQCYGSRKWEYAPDFALNTAYASFKGRLNEVVFLFNHPVQQQALRYLDLLYQPAENTIREDEMFYIYKFKDGVR